MIHRTTRESDIPRGYSIVVRNYQKLGRKEGGVYTGDYTGVYTPSKYGNVKTVIDGHVFDSKAEAYRYSQLVLLQRASSIKGFALQPSFLLPGGIRYRPDFLVCGADGSVWAEDVKGVETAAFKLKRKLWQAAFPWLELRIVK